MFFVFGDYQFIVMDVIGCVFVFDIFVLSYFELFELDVVEFLDIICDGDVNGFIEIQVVGGIVLYIYNWIGIGNIDVVLVNVFVGSYCFFVMDVCVCDLDIIFVFIDLGLIIVEGVFDFGNVCDLDDFDIFISIVSGGV